MDLTGEQKEAISLSLKSRSLKVNAFAGAGKTSTLVEMAKAMPHERILYICFNKSIAVEASKKFPINVECKTVHSLAYGAVVTREPKFRKKLEGRLNGGMVAKELGVLHEYISPLTFAGYGNFVLMTINRFLNSGDIEINNYHLPKKDITDFMQRSKKIIPDYLLGRIVEDAIKIKNRMLDPNDTLYMTHDSYLKLFQLSKPTLRKYSVIMLDEAQDSNGIILSIIENTQARKIYVGDEFQQIYSWRGAVNAMRLIKSDGVATLTKSFRFGSAIANLASLILVKELGANQTVKGFEKIQSKIDLIQDPECMLFRTNGALISEAVAQIQKGKQVSIVGNLKEMICLIEGIQELEERNKSRHPELRDFLSYQDFEEYANSELGRSYKPILKAISDYGYSYLKESLSRIEKIKEHEADMVLSTAHKSKGREWDTVKLGGDFSAIDSYAEKKYGQKNKEEDDTVITKEEFNLLYVAVTRAKKAIDVSEVKYFELLANHLKKEEEKNKKAS